MASRTMAGRFLAALGSGAVAVLLACFARPADATQVNGFLTGGSRSPTDFYVEIYFTCPLTGTTCPGIASITEFDLGCSNSFNASATFTINGLNLSQPGAIQGTVVVAGPSWTTVNHPNGTCTYTFGAPQTDTFPMTGTWDGVRGTMRLTGTNFDSGAQFNLDGTFTADSPVGTPVFPMTVNANITPTVSAASAQIQFRPQDVGTTGSVYVFAIAPADRVIGGSATPGIVPKSKNIPVQCVLAQLSGSGQLVAVSASSLQAYVTGVLSGQGQAVTILDGVPTVNIGGATFYVGYGPNATQMINGGINRSAVTVPGATTCKPQAPQTGWWWNPQEDGRGYSIEVRGNNLFFASFLYDASGRSSWYVATGPVSLDGSLFNGELLGARGGQALGAAYAGFPTLRNEGAITLAFNDASVGTLVWPGGAVPIQRFNIVPNGLTLPPVPNQPETGWWWNPNEAGRGFFLEWQGGILNIAGYMYDDAGNPVWYLTQNATPTTNAQSFSSSWWSFGNGMTLMGPWRPHTRTNDNVAPVTIQFQGNENAIMTLPNGRTTALTRHRF